MREFTITKKIAKHGGQGVIVVPKVLDKELKPGTLVEVRMKVIENRSDINGRKT